MLCKRRKYGWANNGGAVGNLGVSGTDGADGVHDDGAAVRGRSSSGRNHGGAAGNLGI